MLIYFRLATTKAQTQQSLDVEPLDTLKMVKMKIEEKHDIPAERQLLSFAGKHLQDQRTLADYNIQKESTLRLELRPRGSMNIVVRLPTRKFIKLGVKPSASGKHLKMLIAHKEGLPPTSQRLYFEGQELEDGRVVSDYNIQEGSELQLAYNIRAGSGIAEVYRQLGLRP